MLFLSSTQKNQPIFQSRNLHPACLSEPDSRTQLGSFIKYITNVPSTSGWHDSKTTCLKMVGFLPTDSSSSQACLHTPRLFRIQVGPQSHFIYKPTERTNFWNRVWPAKALQVAQWLCFLPNKCIFKGIISKSLDIQTGLEWELEFGRKRPCYTHQKQPPQMALEALGSHSLTVLLDSRYLRFQDYVAHAWSQGCNGEPWTRSPAAQWCQAAKPVEGPAPSLWSPCWLAGNVEERSILPSGAGYPPPRNQAVYTGD